LAHPLPIIFLSAYSEVSLAVELMRRGAVNYLLKPLRPAELVSAVQEALAKDHLRRRAAERRQRVREGIAVLSAKERDVLRMIGEGKENGQVAEALGISRRGVELRRVSMMKKLHLRSPTGLLRFALLAKRIGWPYLEVPVGLNRHA